MRSKAFTTTIGDRKVTANPRTPTSLEEWSKTGYSDSELSYLLWFGWKIVEAQKELRDEAPETDEEATKIAQARLKAGWRERKKASSEVKKERQAEKMRKAGHSQKEIDLYFQLTEIANS